MATKKTSLPSVGLQRRKVYVDDREAANHPMWMEDGEHAKNMPGTFVREGFLPIVARNDIGDFWINMVSESPNPFAMPPQIVVESKTPDDLINAMRDDAMGRDDTRIRHQVEGMLKYQADGAVKKHTIIPAIMTVGVVSLPGGKGGKNEGVSVEVNGRRVIRKWSYFEIEAATIAFQRLGILHVRAPRSSDVPTTLRHLAEVCERSVHFQDPGLARVAMLGPRMTMLATALTAVEGVGPTTARLVAGVYKTFAAFYEQASVNDLQQIPGIGKVTAAAIYDVFHNEHAESQESLIEQAFGQA